MLDTEPDFLARRVGHALPPRPPVRTQPRCTQGRSRWWPSSRPCCCLSPWRVLLQPCPVFLHLGFAHGADMPRSTVVFGSGVRPASEDRHESSCHWLRGWFRPSGPVGKRSHKSVSVFEAGPEFSSSLSGPGRSGGSRPSCVPEWPGRAG